MNNWINLSALWRIVGIGLLSGAGLPAIFALGVRALGGGPDAAIERVEGEQAIGASRTGLAMAALCFAVVLAACGYGIYLIVRSG
jgi:hypothetical protein